jgi:ABC-type multidrug transport system fused ATPase/permease subunit
LSTIQNAHQIYVLDRGNVIEQGTHETLMAKEGGKYQSMVKSQQMERRHDDKSDIVNMEKR